MFGSGKKTIERLQAELEERDEEIAKLRSRLASLQEKAAGEAQFDIFREVECEGARLAALGAWQFNTETQEIFWAPEVFRIYGIEQGEVPSLEECLSHYVEKDRERVRTALSLLTEQGVPFDLECGFIDAKGNHRFVRSIGRVQDKKPGVAPVLSGVIQDITGQHQMRRGQEAFFALTPDLVGAVDYDSRPVTLNPSWQSQLGWSKHELIQQGIDCVVHEEDRAAIRAMIASAIKSGKIESIQNRVIAKSGELHWFSWRLFADQSMEMLFISARDVTRRVKVETALKEAKVQADFANRAKSDFLAIMSHELRTPLNPILGFADLLISETENPEHKEILQSISEAGEHLTSVIGDVLDFAKIEAGRTEIEEDEFDLEDLVSKQVRVMEGQVSGKPVKVSFNHKAAEEIEKETMFLGDREKIVRILYNLLGNAIKFTDRGSVTLDSELKLTEDGRVLWHVDVADTGIGIPEGSLIQVFQPFSQADSSATRKYGGTGLGLAICKKLIELMGGQISVKSRYGEGACFSFSLPLKIGKATATAKKDSAAIGSLTVSGGPRVLLVEDNDTNIFYIRRLLEKMECGVTTAESGEEALARYRPEYFDLILLDIHMPGVSGIEVLQQIRADEKANELERIPILMLTADVLPTTRETCLESGADGFLTKPVRAGELNRAIKEVVESDEP
jgi:PAS domain S-box-containing protein